MKLEIKLAGPGRAGPGQKFCFFISGWAGLGPKFQFPFRAGPGSGRNFSFPFGPGSGRNFNFSFGPCRAEIVAMRAGLGLDWKIRPVQTSRLVLGIKWHSLVTEFWLFPLQSLTVLHKVLTSNVYIVHLGILYSTDYKKWGCFDGVWKTSKSRAKEEVFFSAHH